MALFICSLNSGSNGNCYYVGNGSEAVLIDAGISCREIEKRMQQRELPMQKLKALFISHEHSDHISGVRVLSRKYRLPVYITEATLRFSQLDIDSSLVRPFSANSEVSIGSLTISAFSKQHDACDPHSFIIRSAGTSVGVFTDIGSVCSNLIYHFRQCHAAFLESNYDEQLLENGRYPYHLKRRIRGGNGHLSNIQALNLCLQHKPQFMTHLFLAHLSRENNCPRLVEQLFSSALQDMHIVVASRHEASAVYSIRGTHVPKPLHIVQQLSLFN